MLSVVIEGPDKSGKGTLMALLAHHLESLGCNVVVQMSDTHNATKLAKPDNELVQRLQSEVITLKEMQTAG